MLIRSLRIRNFRSCENVEVTVDRLTAIVGANGCGKSAVLRALDLFYAQSPKVDAEDFYDRDTAHPIEIEVTFEALTEDEQSRFAPYIVGDQLAVVRVLRWENGKPAHSLHGARLRYAPFAAFRAAPNATVARPLYTRLREEHGDLPAWTNFNEAKEALDAWETSQPESCARTRDEGAFFGWKGVGQGYLGQSTRLLFVPAVRDAASDAADGKGSVIAELMDLVVRRTLAEHEEYRTLVEETRAKYLAVFDRTKFEQVGALSGRLTRTLQTYVPDASVDIEWDASEIALPLPRANVLVAEDGFPTTIGGCGHGLQRAFILTLLKHLAAAQPAGSSGSTEESTDANGATEGSEPIPDLVLVIEEPELFQHPSRQRHFAEVLRGLTTGSIPGVANRAQVLYCTHSPHFVGLDRFEQVRILRKVPHEVPTRPRVTRVHHATLLQVARRLAKARDEALETVDGEAQRARLTPLMTPGTSEGFFADVAVFVEGEGDRGAIAAVAESMGYSLSSAGIALIVCGGKANVLSATAVFREIGVATYCVWDCDASPEVADDGSTVGGKKSDTGAATENKRLLRLHALPVEDFPGLVVEAEYACFATNLEQTLELEIGAKRFGEILAEVTSEYGMSGRKNARKNAHVLAAVIRRAGAEGRSSPTLSSIVERVLALRHAVKVAPVPSDVGVAGVEEGAPAAEEAVALALTGEVGSA